MSTIAEEVEVLRGARSATFKDLLTHRAFVPAAKFGPAPAESTAANPRRRPQMVAGSFSILVIEK